MLGGCKEVPGQRWGDGEGEGSQGGHAFLCRTEHRRDACTREVLEQLVMGITGD